MRVDDPDLLTVDLGDCEVGESMKAIRFISVILFSLIGIATCYVSHDSTTLGTVVYPSRTRECRYCREFTGGIRKKSLLYMSSETKKETTWERMTGPKLFKSIEKIDGIHSVPLAPLRIVTGLLMIHHGSEGGILPANFNTPEFQGFIDYIIKPYFGFLPGPPELWSAVHDYVEFFGGICFTIGFLTRPASLLLFGTMLSAVYFHLSSTGLQGFPFGHVPNYSYDFEEPTLYAFIFFYFWFNGPVSSDQSMKFCHFRHGFIPKSSFLSKRVLFL
jgi:uncharacterized membrane protein YphA (DoxX/SURF4 family)